ncbi:hypothetical protein [Planctomicrobium sp. SH664]|uniref:hypothetical protein n=1 Tax=Planctomicrobium sp. SH664 TaxID=3448125 RepID=UPI003F5B2670
MTTKLTLFTATLVQDSALSVSGLDRETSANLPFALVEVVANGHRKLVPTLAGRGLKGAAVAMAKRFFDPLPRSVSDDIKFGALRRSAWEFADATAVANSSIRAGVGIRQKTGACADGVLYDREVIPAGTKWQLSFRVDWSQIPEELREDEGHEAEGILGYVLQEHWAKERCWLGGGVARGLGWCHIEDLKAYRFDELTYDQWIQLGRPREPHVSAVTVPVVAPTRSWCFHTLDVAISFGEYKPDPDGTAWGLDMFTVSPHATQRTVQATGDGAWAQPVWATNTNTPDALTTDRALLMEDDRPLLPGASVRGPLRHVFSRKENAQAGKIVVQDPHRVQEGEVGAEDPAGQAFGTVNQSSRILIRDARADGKWSAAKLHMHAEDEFSASTFGTSKRDAVRLLQGTFPVRIVVDGATREEVEPLCKLIDREVALGALGHLLIGGHKTRGAGAGHWQAQPWISHDVKSTRSWAQPKEPHQQASTGSPSRPPPPADTGAWVKTTNGPITEVLTLSEAAKLAKAALGDKLVAWWCDPTIDLNLHSPPATFGNAWPGENDKLHVDEVAFYAERAVWRAARTSNGPRFACIMEIDNEEDNAQQARVVHRPARLHAFQRFSSANTGNGNVLLREWYVDNQILGFTLTKEQR